MASASAAATCGPGSFPPRSPVAYTLVAPCAPSVAATAAASPAYTASTESPSSRALASISSVIVLTLSPSLSAYTQTLLNPISDHLQVLERFDDLLEAFAVVFDDRAGLAFLGLVGGADLLTGPGPADDPGVEAEVGDLHLVDRLRLRGHDPLEARVARL